MFDDDFDYVINNKIIPLNRKDKVCDTCDNHCLAMANWNATPRAQQGNLERLIWCCLCDERVDGENIEVRGMICQLCKDRIELK